jgi:hypothetical protein
VGLGLTVILVNVLLVALVAIGVSQRGFPGWWATLRGEWAPLDEALDVEDPLADWSAVTTPPPDDEQGTTAPAPQTAVVTEEPQPEAPSVEELYEEGGDITILVLGDRTGVHDNDWPAAWGRILSAERSVEIYSPLQSDPTQYGAPLELGADGATVSIYNASYLDGTPSYAAERLSLLGAEDPDVILLNYGRASTPQDLPGGLDLLWSAIEDEFPDTERYAVVAPPRLDGQAPTVEVTREWAEEKGAPLIDVAELFEDEGIVTLTQSVRDPLAVNIYGNEVWAREVHEEVFGSTPPAPEPGDEAVLPATRAEVEPSTPVEVEASPATTPQPDPVPYIPPYQPAPEPTAGPTPTPTAVPAPAPAPTEPEPTGSEPTHPPDTTDPEPTDPPTEDTTDLSRVLPGIGL